MPQGKRVSPLKRPIAPELTRAQAFGALEKRMVKAGMVLPRSSPGVLARRGYRKTQQGMPVMKELVRAANGNGPNVELARKLAIIFTAAEKGELNLEADAQRDHQRLVNIANNLAKVEKIRGEFNKVVSMKINPAQQAILEYWWNLIEPQKRKLV